MCRERIVVYKHVYEIVKKCGKHWWKFVHDVLFVCLFLLFIGKEKTGSTLKTKTKKQNTTGMFFLDIASLHFYLLEAIQRKMSLCS